MLRMLTILLALAVPYAALAADIDVALDADNPGSLTNVTVDVSVNDTLARTGQLSFTFEPQPDRVAERVSVATDGAPAGFSDFDLEIDLPFFATHEPLELAAPVLLASLPRSRLGPLWAMQHLVFTNRLSNLIRVNARSGRGLMTAMRFIRDIPRPANAEDGRVALLFARSAAALTTEHFVLPDPGMDEAMAFVEYTLADPEAAARIFPRAQDRADATAAVTLFNQYRAVQLKKLVDAADAAAATASEAANRYARIIDLARRIEQARQSDDATALLPIEMRNLENAAICAHDAITWPVDAPPADAGDRLNAALKLLGQLDDRLEEFADSLGPSAGDNRTLQRAQARRIELDNRYDAVSASSQPAPL